MPDTPSPKQLARQAERELKAAANVLAARQAKTYFKPDEEVRIFGVDTPAQRRIAGALFQRVRGAWAIDDALVFCETLIKRREMELKNVGIFILARRQQSFDKSLLRNVESWLANDHCANWAATDALCGEVLGPLIRQHPDLTAKLKTWTGKRNLWLREAGKPDPARLENFLLNHGPKIPRTTLRYAIERFPPEKRKMLLEKTKGE
ncbi:MAG: DNA alkylation repair protein [Blastocatellia bacterium]